MSVGFRGIISATSAESNLAANLNLSLHQHPGFPLRTFAYLCVLRVERVSGLNFSVCSMAQELGFRGGEK
jgi:hypothetical protein